MAGVSYVSTRAYEAMVAGFARGSASAKASGAPLAVSEAQKSASPKLQRAVSVSISAAAQKIAASVTTGGTKAAGTVPTPLPNDPNVRAVMFVGQNVTKSAPNPGAWYWRTDTTTATYTAGQGLSNAAKTLTYSFLTSASGSDNTNFRAMTDNEKSAVRAAFDYVSSVCGLSFTEASGNEKGNICFGTNKQKDSAGYASPPTGATTTSGSVNLFMSNSGVTGDIDMSVGSYGWEALVHEIGHTLGLKHPGNYNAGGGGAPGPYIAKTLDTRRFSLMSYNDATDMKMVNVGNNRAWQTTVNPTTFQAYDIAALQWLYGAPTNPVSEADFSDSGPMSMTLTNAGQTSGTIIGNQNYANVIDLNPVDFTSLAKSVTHYSSIGIRDPYADLPEQFNTAAKFQATFGTKLSATYTGVNNLALAPDSVYTTAIGGSKNDTLIGNAAADITLKGNEGIDLFVLDPDGKAAKGQQVRIIGEDEQSSGNGKNVLVLPGVSAANWTFNNGTLTSSDGYYALTVSDISAVKFGRNGLALSLNAFSSGLNKTTAITQLNQSLGKLTAVANAPNLYSAANGNTLVWGTGIDAKQGVTAKTSATQLMTNEGYFSLGANQSIATSKVNADKSLTLVIAQKTGNVTNSLTSITFDADGRQVGDATVTSLSSLREIVQAENSFKVDLNGDKKIGFVVSSKLTPTAKTVKFAIYTMTSNGETLTAFAPEGGKPGSALAPNTTMLLRNPDGSTFVPPAVSSYGYAFSTQGGTFANVTLTLNGRTYAFGSDGVLASVR